MALTNKQQAFVNHYLATWNAAEAARRAGYSEKIARQLGHETLQKPAVRAAIVTRLAELAMSADEVLVRLTEHARGSMADFIILSENGDPYFDYEAAKKAGKLHLIKKLKVKRRDRDVVRSDEETEHIVEVDTELELYDAQAALVALGKYHKLFTENVDMHHSGGVSITADDLAQAAREVEQWTRERRR